MNQSDDSVSEHQPSDDGGDGTGSAQALLSVRDRRARRRFLRTGSALLFSGGAVVAATPALADCDRGGGAKNAQDANSDSDQGATADAAGCGRREAPKISRGPTQRRPEPVAANVTRVDAKRS